MISGLDPCIVRSVSHFRFLPPLNPATYRPFFIPLLYSPFTRSSKVIRHPGTDTPRLPPARLSEFSELALVDDSPSIVLCHLLPLSPILSLENRSHSLADYLPEKIEIRQAVFAPLSRHPAFGAAQLASDSSYRSTISRLLDIQAFPVL